MAQMPRPMATAPRARRVSVICGGLAMESAKPEMAMAIASDARVVPTSYDSEIGRENASMPTKCIDQMPQPIATAPPVSHRRAGRWFALDTREERLSAVYETNTATTMESATSQ